jgi:amino acid transporter
VFETVSQNISPARKRTSSDPQEPPGIKTTNHPHRLSQINPTFNVPINAILAVALFNILFGLLYLGPSVAFNAYISSCTIFLNCSYAGPILILLIRGRKTIAEQRPDFALGKVGGYVANGVAVVYVGVTSVVCLLGGVARKRMSIVRGVLTR